MNKELESEAEKYAHNYFNMHETNNYKALQQGFIAGATSKYIEKQKLEFAIEQIRPLENICWEATLLVEELEQKLKEL